jgi:molecular chaperone DnaK
MAEGHVVGIDLGTTNSLVAYMEGDRPVVIPGVDGSNLVPSVVALDPITARGGRPTVTVGNSARKALIETPERVIYSVKRLMGRGLEEIQDELKLFPFHLAGDLDAGPPDPNEVPRIQLGELRFTPPEISAYILRQLKRNAERFFGAPVTQAVITVPAYFNDAQRQATKDAGRMAGLEVLRLVNEPTAAALAYGLDRAKEGTIAVYDLGGGTFDISILKLRDGISKCSPPTATRTWAATTSTICFWPLPSMRFTPSTALNCAGIRAPCRLCATPPSKPKSSFPPS